MEKCIYLSEKPRPERAYSFMILDIVVWPMVVVTLTEYTAGGSVSMFRSAWFLLQVWVMRVWPKRLVMVILVIG